MSLNKHRRRNNPYKPKRDFKGYLKFVILAVAMLAFLEFVVFKDGRPYLEGFKKQYAQEAAAIESVLPAKVVYPESGESYFEAPKETLQLNENQSLLPERQLMIEGQDVTEEIIASIQRTVVAVDPIEKTSELETKSELKPAQKTATPKVKKEPRPVFNGKKSYIAIVIDDVGMNVTQSRASIRLPKEVTLALLPYAPNIKSMAREAKKEGHELIIHTPMEAMNKDQPLGGLALYADMNSTELNKEFNKIAASFDGYVGINNHMGSRLTQDDDAMKVVMAQLKKRGLYFLDSKTIGSSVAADWAQKQNVPFAIRDVFLDHEDTPEFVRGALLKAERQALKYGSSIAIGHPKAVTMAALNAWIPTLKAKNIELVPVSRLLRNTKTASKPKAVVKTVKTSTKTIKKKLAVKKEPVKNVVTTNVIAELTAEEEGVIFTPAPIEVKANEADINKTNTNLKIKMVKESVEIKSVAASAIASEIKTEPAKTLVKPRVSYPVN